MFTADCRCNHAQGKQFVCVSLDSCPPNHTDFFFSDCFGLWHSAVWHQVLGGTRNAQGLEVMLEWHTAWQ